MKKSKKLRKMYKRDKLRNKKLAKKYPWLRPIKWCWDKDRYTEVRDNRFDYKYIPIFIETGWWKAFGIQFCDEIQAEYETGSCPMLYVLEWKEKWGGLRIDFGNATDKIWEIVKKYEDISEETCYVCGTPAPMTNAGWLLPLCKNCYEKHWNSNLPYEDVI